MAAIHPGRYTAKLDESVVVFLIGMRINRLWKVWAWLPVLLAMVPMLWRLQHDPSKGLLASRPWIGWRQVMLVQHWESFETLEAFARSPGEPHVDAWARFNHRSSGSGDTGIWHETYLVEPGTAECIYGDMPEMGLPAATQHVPVTGTRLTARQRLEEIDEEGPPLEPTVQP